MAGNVAEWTSTAYSGSGLELMNDSTLNTATTPDR